MSASTSQNSEIPTWDILESYFKSGGGGENANPLVKHQIESFNEFLDKKLIQIIQGFNPIQIFHNYNEEIGDFMYKININILQPSITKPMYQTSDGSQMLMTPHTARMNNLTYAVNLYTDIHVVTDVINQDGITERSENTVPSVCIGRIPMMVRSKGCILTQMPNFAEGNGKYECRYDPGGYFIINGNEKVVICQDRISENKTLVFAPTTNSDGLSAEIRSMPDGVFLPPKTTSIHLSAKPNHLGHIIRMNTTFLRSEIPVFTMFRALGIETDRDIISYIVYDLENPKNQRMITELLACCEDGSEVHTQADAHDVLLKIVGTTGTPREYLEKPQVAREILNNMIVNDFLPHVGPCFRRKALYLGYMVRKLLATFLGYQDYDNRDSYLHKRIDTTGVLMSNLFRQCYSKMVKEMRNLVTRELNLWRANSDDHANLITSNNVHKFFKPTLLETGMRYALSTGNWGVKTIGTFQNIRQGVAQVLNRMSYLSTLSHLRRINTPMEKSGKLIQPRKLENSQFGMICPAECFHPETPILLWDGTIKKAEDIEVGDYLIDDKGNSVRVRSTCAGSKMMYDIIPKKKNFMSYTVTDNHILTLKVKKYKGVRNHRGKKEFSWFDKKELRYKYKDFNNEDELRLFAAEIDDDDVIDITIEQYLSLPKHVQRELYVFKSDGINWEHKEVALDPYIFGMWLGDGLSNGYGFVTADKELLNKWIEWGVDNDATVRKGSNKYLYHLSSTINNTQPGIACNKTEPAPLKKLLAKYDLVKNKHIPLDYLVNDRKTRLAVLAGLIDTDGNVRANGHEIRIPQGERNYQIIYDAEFLARSLGFSCHVNSGMCSYTVNGEKRHKPYKELTITGQYLYEIPTVLPRKKLNKFDNPTFEKRCSSFLQSPFTLVEKDVQEFVGWQVEGNGRFLLGDMSVSHNTPEGSAVGLVKNMAMSTQITISMSSAYIRTCVVDLGTCVMTDDLDEAASRTFIKNMGSDTVMHVNINGDLIGYHPEPVEFYKKLKSLKRQGVLAPTTAIVWDIKLGTINISTEAGRMCRPLYIVDELNQSTPSKLEPITEEPVKKTRGRKSKAEKERLAELEKQKEQQQQSQSASIPDVKRVLRIPSERGDDWRSLHGHKSFIEFVAPLHSGKYTEGFIELMDTDEIDKAMVAMTPKDLERGVKGTSLPPCYTHCEIHPSLLNGVLAVNIPFSDHNQSPRNCYQCLWEEEPVLMAEGGWKKIKDVRENDYVICFHPQTLAPSITRVVHQYVRPNRKPMTLLITSSGRSILATRDHKIMTNQGWVEAGDFCSDPDRALVGIQVGVPDKEAWGSLIMNTVTGGSSEIPLDTLNDNVKTRLGEMGLFPLTTSDTRMPILCRMVGWTKQGGVYQHRLDQEAFDDDAKYLGFIQYGANDTALKALLEAMIVSMPVWVPNISVLAKREMMAGYLGARNVEPNVFQFDEWIQQVLPDMVVVLAPNPDSEFSLIYKFGCRYHTIRLLGFSRLDEYVRYKNYMKTRRIADVMTQEKWLDTVKCVGNTIFVPVFSCSGSRNCMISDITVESENHSFIGGACFTVSNSAMGKQAVGVYMSNFNHRIDTMAHVLNYPQRPLVYTKLSKYTNNETMPSGINAVVAIMTYTGFNMEDSVMINQSALDRGLFTSTYYKSYRDQCNKNHSTGEEEVFARPDPTCTANMKPYNYDKLGEDGFIPKNTEIDGNDILVGKIMPHKVQGVIYPRDTSMSVKANDEGFVDMNYTGSNGEGYKFCKVRIRKYRKPVVGDKVACLTSDHEVLTRYGFKPIDTITLEDEVAVLHDKRRMVYEKPQAVHHYPDFEGQLYHISNQGVDLDVTLNHRMWVSKRTHERLGPKKYKDVWSEYDFNFAENIIGKRVRYMANADWEAPDYQFILPEYVGGKNGKDVRPARELDMDAWLTFFGIWMAEGWACGGTIGIAANKPRVQKALKEALPILGYKYSLTKAKKVNISEAQLAQYFRPLSVGAINKYLPDWVWSLSQRQCKVLLDGLVLGDGNWSDTSIHYSTSSTKLRDDVYRLIIHCGYAAGSYERQFDPEKPAIMKDGRKIIKNEAGWIVHIRKNRTNPTVNHGHTHEQEIQEEYTYDYKGPVYCLTVSTGVFMVRKNFKHVWTGNSRHAQKGTIGMIYSQEDMPFSKDGIIPDVILNPHAIPSRMTIAQLMECIMGKACTFMGSFGDATPFSDCTVDNIADMLEKFGMEKYGNEILYHGRTGHQIKTEIFIGPTFYQRLKHMVADKAFSRGSNGPVVLLTRQPAEGRARNGGLRFGKNLAKVRLQRSC